MAAVQATKPYGDVVAEDGVHHVLWRCSVEDALFFEEAFKSVNELYIADGHHRSAAAYRVAEMRRQAAIAAGK